MVTLGSGLTLGTDSVSPGAVWGHEDSLIEDTAVFHRLFSVNMAA